MKTCAGCGLEKDEGEFYVNHRIAGGLSGRCKPCYRAKVRARQVAIKAGKWEYTGSRGTPGNRSRSGHKNADTNRWRARAKDAGVCPCVSCSKVRGGTPEQRAELIARVALEMGVAVAEGRWAGPKPMTQEQFEAHHATIREGRKKANTQVWT